MLQICLRRWGVKKGEEDKRIKKFIAEYAGWMKGFSTEEEPTIKALLCDFDYYTRSKVNESLYKLNQKLQQNDNITYDNTIYTCIRRSDGHANSSSEYWVEFLRCNDIPSVNAYDNMQNVPIAYWEKIDNIVIIDDMAGTGKSLIKELDKHKSTLVNKNIFFICIYIMKEAEEKITNYCKENNISNVNISIKSANKATYNNKKLRNDVLNISGERSIRKPLGYEKSESLVAFHNNTPNNTLGLFWFNVKGGYTSIFPRNNSPRPGFADMNKNRNGRKVENYARMKNDL